MRVNQLLKIKGHRDLETGIALNLSHILFVPEKGKRFNDRQQPNYKI